MTDDLAWTSALGEAYYNQPADVLNALQTLRKMAMDAGTLKSTEQQQVEVQAAPSAENQVAGQPGRNQTIIIQPAQPTVVYVPSYNPATVYGAPVQTPPGYTGGQLAAASLLSFGVGMLLGAAINNNNNDWNTNWHGGTVVYNRNVYVSNSAVVARPPYYGYRPPGGYPPGAYPPRPGYPPAGYPRPMPYNAAGQRPYNGAIPATRPYNAANAKNYAANNPNLTKPNFPNPNTLPNKPANTNLKGNGVQANRPKQPANQSAGTGSAANRRTGANRPAAATQPAVANRPANNRTPDSQRGYAGGGNAKGGRTGALGGYQDGGFAQASSVRGQASLSGQNRQTGGGGGGASPADTGKGARAGGGGRPPGGGGRRRQ